MQRQLSHLLTVSKHQSDEQNSLVWADWAYNEEGMQIAHWDKTQATINLNAQGSSPLSLYNIFQNRIET